MIDIRANKTDLLTTKNYDLHKRRMVNAGTSVDADDYVTKKELPERGFTFDAVKKWAQDWINTILNGNTVSIGLNSRFITIGNASTQLGFFGAAPAPQQVLNAYTTAAAAGAYTGITNAVGGSVYATVADLNTLRVDYENLRVAYDNLRAKLQASTLIV